MATLIKDIILCQSSPNIQYFFFDLSPYYANWYATAGTLPTGVNKAQDSLTGSVVALIVNYSTFSGTKTVTITGKKDSSSGDTFGTFTIKITKTSCATEQGICCNDDAQVIRWLCREGGIKSFTFNGVREFDVKVGDALQFINSNSQAQYSQRKRIYNGKRLTTGDITKEQSDYLDELKYSIQAWEWDGTTATPILLNNDSFTKYKSTDKFFDVSIQYIVSKEINVQTQ